MAAKVLNSDGRGVAIHRTDLTASGDKAELPQVKKSLGIGDRINMIIGKLADANDSLKGAINVADFNDEEKLGKGKEMVDRLTVYRQPFLKTDKCAVYLSVLAWCEVVRDKATKNPEHLAASGFVVLLGA